MGRNAKDKRDIYYRLAKQKEFRSRSAFKLIQIDFFSKIFERLDLDDIVVDLCSSPGGWSQVCSSRINEIKHKEKLISNIKIDKNNSEKNSNNEELYSLQLKENHEYQININITSDINLTNTNSSNKYSKLNSCSKIDEDINVIAIDVQKMGEIPGVFMIQGDITNQTTLNSLKMYSKNKKIKLVICDGAPDITGNTEFDLYVQNHLVYASLNFAIKTLSAGGCFISKVYKSNNLNYLMKCLQLFFNNTCLLKPKACRNASYELFVVCDGFNWEKYISFINKKEKNQDNKKGKDELDFLISSQIESNNLYNPDYTHISKFAREEFLTTDLEYLSCLFTDDDDNDMHFGKRIEVYEEENIIFTNLSLFSIGVDIIQVGEEQHDSDKTYDLESTNYVNKLDPVQMPIDPPYKAYCNSIKGISLQNKSIS
jgi:23S rRNA U2552 (ribose-2'-O)-methylase RlmE/FtsJ